MLYEFKSRATGTVVMTQEVGERILMILSRSKERQGVILPEQMPAAIAALKKAIDDEGQRKPALPSGNATESPREVDEDDSRPAVSLAQRAFPLIEMLEAAHRAGKEVTWGV